jgi:hypothetical protein
MRQVRRKHPETLVEDRHHLTHRGARDADAGVPAGDQHRAN